VTAGMIEGVNAVVFAFAVAAFRLLGFVEDLRVPVCSGLTQFYVVCGRRAVLRRL
jgi:hypothetical protein